MKKKTYKKLVFLLVTSLCIFSCSEDFLEETNPVELSTSSFWLNINDLETGLTAVYNAFKDGNILRTGDEYNRSDMTFPGWGRPNTSNVYWLQTFNNSSDAPNAKWAALYKGIFRANQVIEATERLYPEFTGETLERADLVMAQARTFRGLFYFYLYTGFNNGAVPILDYVPQSIDDYYQPISPAETVQEFYRADLEYGVENLPMTYSEGKAGRLTSGTALALLGKSYLYEGDYTMAAQYFKTIIDDHPYSLTPDIGSNFTTRDEFNEESILEIGYSLNYKEELSPYGQDQNSSTINFAFSPVGGWRSLYPACWLNDLYRNEVLDMQDPRNTVSRPETDANGLIVRDEEGNPVMEENVPRVFSLRTSASIALVDDVDTQYYLKTSAQGTAYNNAEHCYWRKYTNWDIAESERDISATTPRSGVNVRVIRLADIYLMYAEALIAGGTNDAGVDEALVYINRVRRRSAVRLLGLDGTGEYPVNDHDNVSYNAQSLMEHLMHVERPLELSAEGNAIRTIDLRRWGITKQRFEELSQRQYWSDNFKFETEKGESGTRWGSILSGTEIEGKDPEPKWTEFEQAAANYTENLHGYWPIPNSEEVANPRLYDTP
ncbi:RagB/SusD family nutrient uptake outer membrane protein [Seonamhaeicola algicola]|uniref:RagB/SusD family nutrient uptake outer membrane protein n=1 Tax=Seonamhaeicola algicola TaxID=1719036 RepID=A0A5C7APB4_9FLAO|nr:RagB/SusD family nutrient uptake outer membrane protein [Seonamhaeicola algicola]TXE10201.1 RagB/SusD family nutrient uptake outer membrane protein [Seonamhaeicola algicola]